MLSIANKDTTWRLFIDYRGLNGVTIKIKYPRSSIKLVFSSIANSAPLPLLSDNLVGDKRGVRILVLAAFILLGFDLPNDTKEMMIGEVVVTMTH